MMMDHIPEPSPIRPQSPEESSLEEQEQAEADLQRSMFASLAGGRISGVPSEVPSVTTGPSSQSVTPSDSLFEGTSSGGSTPTPGTMCPIRPITPDDPKSGWRSGRSSTTFQNGGQMYPGTASCFPITNYPATLDQAGGEDWGTERLEESLVQMAQGMRLYAAAQANVRRVHTAMKDKKMPGLEGGSTLELELGELKKQVARNKVEMAELTMETNRERRGREAAEEEAAALRRDLAALRGEMNQLRADTLLAPGNPAGGSNLGGGRGGTMSRSASVTATTTTTFSAASVRSSSARSQSPILPLMKPGVGGLSLPTPSKPFGWEKREAMQKSEEQDRTSICKEERGGRARLTKFYREMKGFIRVVVRVRPLLSEELASGGCPDSPRSTCSSNSCNTSIPGSTRSLESPSSNRGTTWVQSQDNFLPHFNGQGQIVLKERHENRNGGGTTDKPHSFNFDRVFDPSASQQDVCCELQPVVDSVMDGANCCVLAYGQTGSGKTHTMLGYQGEEGVMLRAFRKLWAGREARVEAGTHNVSVFMSLMEIYNDSVFDLLLPPEEIRDRKLEVRQVKGADSAVPDCSEALITHGMEELVATMERGTRNRAVGVSNANMHSSRSHCVVRIRMESTDLTTQEELKGSLFMVDLAGSERLTKATATGTVSQSSASSSTFEYIANAGARRGSTTGLKETQAINKSLTALGDVVEALVRKSAHVPYRNSKLTHLLQNALGGGSKVLFIINVSPTVECAQESLCSLNFAHRLSRVQLGATQKHHQNQNRSLTPLNSSFQSMGSLNSSVGSISSLG